MFTKTEENALTSVWLNHYEIGGMCLICGNHGIIDVSDVLTPRGELVTLTSNLSHVFCICPNGQLRRKRVGDN